MMPGEGYRLQHNDADLPQRQMKLTTLLAKALMHLTPHSSAMGSR